MGQINEGEELYSRDILQLKQGQTDHQRETEEHLLADRERLFQIRSCGYAEKKGTKKLELKNSIEEANASTLDDPVQRAQQRKHNQQIEKPKKNTTMLTIPRWQPWITIC